MRSITIRTTQNVNIEYDLAALRDRIGAMVIDLLVVLVSYFCLLFTLLFMIGGIGDGSDFLFAVFFFFLPLSIFVFYHVLCEVLNNGQSMGKQMVGIRVVRLDGREASLGDYALRAIFYLIDLFFSMGIIGMLLISSSAKHQRLGDIVANTTVIKVKLNFRFRLKDILKINTLEDYEIQYPDVKKLSEQDMLLIKSIISRYQKYPNVAHDEIVAKLVVKLQQQLDIQEAIKDKISFLKTLIRDYIVLTR